MTKPDTGLRPICFVVMPYRVKEVPGPHREGVPVRIDFDALWDHAIRPALERIGYQAVRGDADPSGVILQEMLERLTFADLVLGDVTLPNGNAYYEIGIRHVARETDCVLIAADWSSALFDLSQTSAIRYPLPSTEVDAALAERIGAALEAGIPRLRGVRTPYHSLIRDDSNDALRRGAFHDYADRLSAFQAGVREVRLQTSVEARRTKLAELLERTTGAPMRLTAVVVELLTLVRDVLGWAAVIDLVGALPDETRSLPFVEEQRILAVANTGEPLRAIAELEALIAVHGATPERHGLLGGRHKRLWLAAAAARVAKGATRPDAEERRHLDRAIRAYEDGFRLDLNAYYCSSNLPLLLLARDGTGDRERATFLDRLLRLQCERAAVTGTSDEWVPFTLLGAAVRLGDLEEVRQLVDRIETDGAAAWQVGSAWTDLAASLAHLPDPSTRASMTEALQPLSRMSDASSN